MLDWDWLSWPLAALFIAANAVVISVYWQYDRWAAREAGEENSGGDSNRGDVSPERKGAWIALLSTLESFRGIRILTLLGGATIIVGAGFFIDHAIAHTWLGPELRLTIAGATGVAMIAGGHIAGTRKRRSLRRLLLPQTVIAAGIATCFGTVFAAHELYEFIGEPAAFAGMVGMAGIAFALAQRHGWPIAAIGLLGAGTVPALVPLHDQNGMMLFGYLAIVLGTGQLVSRARRWEFIQHLAMWIAAIWSVTWLPDRAVDAAIVAAFLSANIVAYTLLLRPLQRQKDSLDDTNAFLRVATSSVAVMFVAGAVWVDHGGWVGAAGLIGIALATLRHSQRSESALFVPILAAVAGIAALAGAPGTLDAARLIGVALLSGTFASFGMYVLPRQRHPSAWAALIAGAPLLAWITLYFRFGGWERDLPWFLGSAAIALGLLVYTSFVARRHARPRLDNAMAILAFGTALSVTLSLWIAFAGHGLTAALCAQLLLSAWILRQSKAKAMPWIVTILAGVLFARLLADTGLWNAAANWATALEIGAVHLLVTAAFAGAAATVWATSRMTAICLAGLTACGLLLFANTQTYFAYQLLWHGAGIEQAFIRVGLHLSIIGVLGWVLMALGRSPFGVRQPFVVRSILGSWAAISILLALMAALAMPKQLFVDGAPLLNSNSILIGVPALLGMAILTTRRERLSPTGDLAAAIGLSLAGLIWISSETIRFATAYLPNENHVNILTFAWVGFSIAALAWGLVRNRPVSRLASFLVLILTASKLFFYDIAVSDSLTRAATFVGFGLTLLLVAYLYHRFVFRRTPEAVVAAPG